MKTSLLAGEVLTYDPLVGMAASVLQAITLPVTQAVDDGPVVDGAAKSHTRSNEESECHTPLQMDDCPEIKMSGDFRTIVAEMSIAVPFSEQS